MRALSALALAATLALAAPAAAKCALQVLDDTVITNAADDIPAGGGVLVGWIETSDRGGALRDADPVVHPTWRFREKKKKVKAVMSQLAPGLAVYAPKLARGKRHTVALLGDGGKRVGTYRFAKAAGAGDAGLAAPGLAWARRTESHDFRWDDVTDTVGLTAAPPAGAYGVILYRGDAAISWARIDDPAATSIVAYRSSGHCGVTPPGMVDAAVGDAVTVAWVDAFGRLSPRSAVVTVTDASSAAPAAP